MMKKFDIILESWKKAFDEDSKVPAFIALAKGEFTVEHYKAVLREIFHHARENPQIQAFATAYFRGSQRESVKAFYRHAIAEIGHEYLAADDLRALGEDVSRLPFERPLPATTALLSFPFFQIQFHNPIGYLGYLFNLEFMSTRNGGSYMEMLEKCGVPRSAMTFIHEHSTVDVAHNKLMEDYIEDLVVTQDDLDSVIYAARVTSRLYSNMLQEAYDSVQQKKQWGVDIRETIEPTPFSFQQNSNQECVV